MNKLFFIFSIIFLLVSCGNDENNGPVKIENNVENAYSLSEADRNFLSLFAVKEDDSYYYSDRFIFKSIDGSVEEHSVTCHAYFGKSKYDHYSGLKQSIFDRTFIDISSVSLMSYFTNFVNDSLESCEIKMQGYRDASLVLSDIEKDRELASNIMKLIESGEVVEKTISQIEKIQNVDVREALIIYALAIDSETYISDEDLRKLKDIINLKTLRFTSQSLVSFWETEYKKNCSHKSKLSDSMCRQKFFYLADEYIKSQME